MNKTKKDSNVKSPSSAKLTSDANTVQSKPKRLDYYDNEIKRLAEKIEILKDNLASATDDKQKAAIKKDLLKTKSTYKVKVESRTYFNPILVKDANNVNFIEKQMRQIVKLNRNIERIKVKIDVTKGNTDDDIDDKQKKINKSKLAALNARYDFETDSRRDVVKQIVEIQQPFKHDKSNVLEVRNLRMYFPLQKSFFGRTTLNLKAVDNVSFDLKRGTTLGVVGESGCGKTTLGRTILRLYDVTGGKVYFKGTDLDKLSKKEMREMRPKIQMIFQDPYSSLSPRMSVGEIIGEAVKEHNLVPKDQYKDYIFRIMKECGLQTHYYSRYPHEFSGGQRQRICIARSIALNPDLIVCDEPVSALDVSIQAQVINLLKDLQAQKHLTYIFISHDLSVVKHISDNIAVMYVGDMVEYGTEKQIFDNPMHPYTKALLSAVPVPDPTVHMNRIVLEGDIPSPANPPKGCKFHTRCSECMPICKKVTPKYIEYEPGHFVACHKYSQTEGIKVVEKKSKTSKTK